MNRIQTIVVATAFIAASCMATAAYARGGGGMGGGMGSAGGPGGSGGQIGQGIQVRQQTMEQNRIRLHSGTQAQDLQTKAGSTQKKGSTYGPGDGTGNQGDRPQDGTGYGAPANR